MWEGRSSGCNEEAEEGGGVGSASGMGVSESSGGGSVAEEEDGGGGGGGGKGEGRTTQPGPIEQFEPTETDDTVRHLTPNVFQLPIVGLSIPATTNIIH